RPMPLVHPEVGVEVVGNRVPRNLPAHPRLPALDLRLRRARDEGEGRVAGIQMSEVGDLVGEEGAAPAATLRPVGHAGLEEEAVDDQLTAPLEQIEQARLSI